MNRSDLRYEGLTRAAAVNVQRHGVAQTCRLLLVKEKFARYWSTKARQPNFHNGTVGGARNLKFNAATQNAVELLLFAEVMREPRKKLQEYAHFLTQQGYPVNRQYVHHCDTC